MPLDRPELLLISRAFAELLGTAFLAMAVVGSGLAEPSLTVNSLVTGAVLVALVMALGAAMNPVVTLAELARGLITARFALIAVAAQVVGGCAGVVLANLMYDQPAVSISHHDRGGAPLLLSEVIATFGLVLAVFGALKVGRREAVALAVGGYIGAAYWFTSSTSFANPALTLARTLSDSFAGIAPSCVALFVLAQLVGGLLGIGALNVLDR